MSLWRFKSDFSSADTYEIIQFSNATDPKMTTNLLGSETGEKFIFGWQNKNFVTMDSKDFLVFYNDTSLPYPLVANISIIPNDYLFVGRPIIRHLNETENSYIVYDEVPQDTLLHSLNSLNVWKLKVNTTQKDAIEFDVIKYDLTKMLHDSVKSFAKYLRHLTIVNDWWFMQFNTPKTISIKNILEQAVTPIFYACKIDITSGDPIFQCNPMPFNAPNNTPGDDYRISCINGPANDGNFDCVKLAKDGAYTFTYNPLENTIDSSSVKTIPTTGNQYEIKTIDYHDKFGVSGMARGRGANFPVYVNFERGMTILDDVSVVNTFLYDGQVQISMNDFEKSGMNLSSFTWRFIFPRQTMKGVTNNKPLTVNMKGSVSNAQKGLMSQVIDISQKVMPMSNFTSYIQPLRNNTIKTSGIYNKTGKIALEGDDLSTNNIKWSIRDQSVSMDQPFLQNLNSSLSFNWFVSDYGKIMPLGKSDNSVDPYSLSLLSCKYLNSITKVKALCVKHENKISYIYTSLADDGDMALPHLNYTE